MNDLRLGLLLWSHATNWPALRDTARLADYLGYDHIWTSDHLMATVGDPFQPILEGWTILAAWAAILERARLGLLVSANTLRHPAVVAKMITTIDHISEGRAILGLGSGWFAHEHDAHGIPFGTSASQRLDWLDEAAGILRRLLDGGEVDHQGPAYTLRQARHAPRPLQERLPLMIGGGGERKTLRTVARDADLWNLFGTPTDAKRKADVLHAHCRVIGREPAEIEQTVTIKLVIRDRVDDARRAWAAQAAANGMDVANYPEVLLGSPATIADTIQSYRRNGFATVIADAPAPYDHETIERFAKEVRPLAQEG